MNYMATARAYCFDLAATAFLFVSASVMAGRIWRFPFDDEIATLSKIEPEAAREFITNFPTTDDIHPPFSYVFFYGLRQLGCSDAAMRLCSLLLTFLALALCQILVLSWLAQRSDDGRAVASSRIIAVLTFGLMPLALSQGDALRWYPVFAVLIALFISSLSGAKSPIAMLVVSRRTRPCRIDRFFRRIDRSAVLALSTYSAASISLVV